MGGRRRRRCVQRLATVSTEEKEHRRLFSHPALCAQVYIYTHKSFDINYNGDQARPQGLPSTSFSPILRLFESNRASRPAGRAREPTRLRSTRSRPPSWRPQIIQVNLTSENPQPIVAGQKLEARPRRPSRGRGAARRAPLSRTGTQSRPRPLPSAPPTLPPKRLDTRPPRVVSSSPPPLPISSRTASSGSPRPSRSTSASSATSTTTSSSTRSTGSASSTAS